MNVVVLVIDDTRWDSIGAAGNKIVRTAAPRRACIRGHPLHAGAGRDIHLHGDQGLSPDPPVPYSPAWHRPFRQATHARRVRPNLCGGAARRRVWTGYVGKYSVGPPRQADFDFLRAYHGRHWIELANGDRVHVTEQNARDSIDFLRARPKDKPFLLSVGYFAPHAEDMAKEQYLPQDWSAASYEGVKVPPSPLGGHSTFRAVPPFLSNESNEGRIRFKWRFDTPERYQQFMIRYPGSSRRSMRRSAGWWTS